MNIDRSKIQLDPEDEHWRSKVFYVGYGYLAVWLDGKNVFLHKLVLNANSSVQVDHINGDKWDCRKSNLRLASRSENSANREKFIGNYASKYKGVYWRKARKSWKIS